MGFFDEIKSDAMKSVAILGAVLGFVAVIYVVSISVWLLVGIAVLLGGGFLAFKYYFR